MEYATYGDEAGTIAPYFLPATRKFVTFAALDPRPSIGTPIAIKSGQDSEDVLDADCYEDADKDGKALREATAAAMLTARK